MTHLNKLLVMLAFIGLSMSALAQSTYTIMFVSGQGYRVFGDSGPLYTGSSMQAAIDFIKGDASGANCTIQLGGGGTAAALDIGAGCVFDGSGTPSWGQISLTGKATSSSTASVGIIYLKNGISIDCKADLTSTATSGTAIMLYNAVGGIVTISEGTISTNTGVAIQNDGTLSITGGTISATTGMAVQNEQFGKITVSGSAKITSASTSYGTIYLENVGTATDCRLEINGGIVENTNTSDPNVSYAITNRSPGAINISGGKISSNAGVAVWNYSTGALDISGGTISIGENGEMGSLAFAVNNRSTGTVNISGGTISAKSTSATYAMYNLVGTVNISGGTISAFTTHINGGSFSLFNDSGTVNISGGTILATTTSDNGDGLAILNGTGTVNISGGTVSSTTIEAIHNNTYGKIIISGNATVTSGNASNASGTIYLENNGTPTECRLEISGGKIENTANGGNAIYNASVGAVNISGGTISVTTGAAIDNYSTGTLNISGGMISATTGVAVGNVSTGAVNISGGALKTTTGAAIYNKSSGKITISGTTMVSSAISTGKHGAIHLENSGSATNCQLEITGGTIENTSANMGIAIYNESSCTINISGGTISAIAETATVFNFDGIVTVSGGLIRAKKGNAIHNNGTGTANIKGGLIRSNEGYAIFHNPAGEAVNISGGIVFAYGKDVKDVIGGSFDMSDGNAVIAAWNEAESPYTYYVGTSDDIVKEPEAATTVWTRQANESGISVVHNTNIGFISLDVTVEGIYIVTFEGEDVNIPPQSVLLGEKVIKPEDPERIGYDFKGWFTENDVFAEEWDFDNNVVTHDLSLWAKWTETGIETIENEKIQVFPNPTDGVLYITWYRHCVLNLFQDLPQSPENNEIAGQARNDIENVEVFDAMGRMVMVAPVETGRAPSLQSEIGNRKSEIAMDISHLPAGVYFIRITTENGVVTKKVIKK